MAEQTTEPQDRGQGEIYDIYDYNNHKIRKLNEKIYNDKEGFIYKVIEDGKNFNNEIEKDVKELKEKAESIKEKLRKYVKLYHGHLTHKVEEYLGCLHIDSDKLNYLFNEDMNKYKIQKYLLKYVAESQIRKAYELVDKYVKDLESFFGRYVFYSENKCKIKRVNLGNGMNYSRFIVGKFEWPKDDEIMQIMTDESVHVKRIKIEVDDYGVMGGIQVTLSNGKKSPLFKADKNIPPFKTHQMKVNEHVKFLKFYEDHYEFYGLAFFDNQRNVIDYYGGNGLLESSYYKELNENERIIGIFGSLSLDEDYNVYQIHNFGFKTVSKV